MAERGLLAAGDGFVSRATPTADGWTTERVLEADVRCLAQDPRDARLVLAGTQGAGVLRSEDGGRSWRPSGLEGAVVKALAASPVAPGLVYAGLKPAGLARSRDGGRSWEPVDAFARVAERESWSSPAEPPYVGFVRALALPEASPDVVLVGIEVGGVVRSEDGGESWRAEPHGELLDCHELATHPHDPAAAYQGGFAPRAPAAVSHDAGESWKRVRAPDERAYGWAVAADPEDSALWYYSASTGPYAAHGDGGADARIYRVRGHSSVEPLAGGLPVPLDHFPYALLPDPDAPGRVYAGLANGDVWRTPDEGDSWERLPVDLGVVRHGLLLVP